MAVEVKRTFTIPASVERTARALCSESYTLESASAREDLESATHRVVTDRDDRVEFEVLYVEYARSLTGKIDRGRTQRARAWCVWDAETRTLRWTYTTEGSRYFLLEGVFRLSQRGEGTRVDYQATIDVGIPLVGDRLARMVARGHEGDLPRLQALITKHATGL
jgi:hypothetical protein